MVAEIPKLWVTNNLFVQFSQRLFVRIARYSGHNVEDDANNETCLSSALPELVAQGFEMPGWAWSSLGRFASRRDEASP